MIVIIGSNGLMGKKIVEECKERKLQYKGYNHKDIDILNYKMVEKIFIKEKPKYVINCVGIVGVSTCDKNPSLTIKVNSDAVLNLSKLCHKYNSTLVQLSTMGVFSNGDFSREIDEPCPDTLYTSTKLLAERYIINNCHNYYIIRLPFVFGKINEGGTLNNLFLSIKKGKDVIGDTNAYFRYGYNRDMAKDIINIIYSYPYGIYHIYNEGYDSMYKFLVYARKVLNSNSIIKPRKKDKKVMICSQNTKYRIIPRHYKHALKDIINE